MYINFNDEKDRLTPEIRSLMMKAADKAIEYELEDMLKEHKISLPDDCPEIDVSVVDAEEIREINRQFRSADSVTDVLSFPQFEDAGDIVRTIKAGEVSCACLLLGDVVICYDRVIKQAEEYDTGTTREFVYLFVHSLMHLFGYDHENEEDKEVMRAHEEAVMNDIGLGRAEELQ